MDNISRAEELESIPIFDKSKLYDVSKMLPIHKRSDGSFMVTIEHLGGLYHLVEGDKFAPNDLWRAVTEFVAENTDAVTPEPPPELEFESMPESEHIAMMRGFFDTLSAR